MEKPKMFNRAIVFGSVLKKPVKKETKGGSHYASIQIQCPNDLYGDVRVWGKIWGDAGKDAIEDLKQGDRIRLEGVFQQYESEKSGLVTNFNFFNYRFCVGREETDLRAVFVLVGDVTQVGPAEDGWAVTMAYRQNEEGESKFAPEIYRLFVSKRDSLAEEVNDKLIGKRVKVKGFLENEVDDFGETTPTKPLIKYLKTLWSPETSTSPVTNEAPF